MTSLKFCAPLLKCFAAILCGFVISVPASAQPEIQTRRIALIIGNSDYDRDGTVDPFATPPEGMFKDIASACGDARAFAETLRRAQWTEDEIMGGARCDLTAPEMLVEFRRLVQQLSTTAEGERIIAIIYYGGHGAQFGPADGQSQFLFGVRARLDLPRIISGLRQAPRNTGFVANEAVDLTLILASLGDQTRNSLWIITDACRNNQLYGIIQSETDVRIPSISLREIDYRGVVITYSTSRGDFARDHPTLGSLFANTLRQMLSPSTRELDHILSTLSDRVSAAWAASGELGSQQPKSDGRFNGTVCVRDCAPDLDLPTAPRAEAPLRLSPAAARMAANLTTRPPMRAMGSRGEKYAQGGATARPSAARTTQDRVVFDRFAAQAFDAPQQRGLRVDLFWCDDLPGAPARRTRAMAIAERLRERALRQTPGPAAGAALGNLNFVRVRALPLAANLQSDYRYAGDFVIVDADSPAEAALADVVAISGADRLSIRRDGRTPDYVSVVLCRAPLEMSILPRLFIQVPATDWLGVARALRGNLLQALPRANIPAGIEVVPQSPANTELRFYHAGDRDLVFRAAAALETNLLTPVRIRYLPQYSGVARAGQMEVWLGTDQQAPRTPPR